jgi:hypothetical protein
MSPLSRAAWRWRRLLRRKMPPGAGASSGHCRCNRANSTDCGQDIVPAANRYRDSSAPGAAPHRARTFQQCVAKVFDVKPETAHSIRATCFEHPVPPSSTPRSPDSPEESVGKVWQRERLLLRQLHVTAMIVSAAAQEDASGATSRLESSARADSGQSRGGFSACAYAPSSHLRGCYVTPLATAPDREKTRF